MMESQSVYMCFPCYQEFDTLDEVLKHQLTCTEDAVVPQVDTAENQPADISFANLEQLIGQPAVQCALEPEVLPEAQVSDDKQTQPTINIRSVAAEMPRILYQCGDCDELFNSLDLWQHHRKEFKCLQEKCETEPAAPEEPGQEEPPAVAAEEEELAPQEAVPETEAPVETDPEGGEGSSMTNHVTENTADSASKPDDGQEAEEGGEGEEATTSKAGAESEDSPYRKRLATKKSRPKSLLCVDCGASFSLVPELVSHRKTQHGLQEALHRCTVCGECFLNTTLFLYHRKQHRHKDADEDDGAKESPRVMEEVLEEAVTVAMEGDLLSDGAAAAEESVPQPGDPPPLPPAGPSPGQPDSYLCAMCGRSFCTEGGLSAHRREQHGLETPLHRCQQCGQDFMNTTQYLYHRKSHGSLPATRAEGQPGPALHTPKRMRTSLGPAGEPDSPLAKRGKLTRGSDAGLVTPKEDLEETPVSDGLNLPAPSKLVQDWARTSLPHICPHCGKTFTRRVHLRAHVYNHTKEKLFSCKVCSKSFTTSQNLVRHAMTHKGTTFPCNLCGKDFSQAATLKRHHARFHSEAAKKKHGRGRRRQGDVLDDMEGSGHVFACIQCTARFNTVEQLRDHSLLHTDLPFPCTVCGEAFKRRKELDLHALTHEDKEPATCPNCQALFINQSVLDIHMQRCLCPDEDRAAGRGRGQGRGRSTGQMECDLCGHCCMTQDGLDLHRLSHTGQTPLKCPVAPCRRRFASNQALEEHVISHTLNAVNKSRPRRVLRCQVCYKDFAYVSTFNVHMRTHTNERPFGCSTCGKRFRQLPHLQDHERIHSGLKPFSCWVCGKSFSVAARLTEHARTHSGEKPYVCRYCPAAFRSRSNLDKHARAHGDLAQQEAEEAEGARLLSSLAAAAAGGGGEAGGAVQTILLVQGAEGATETVVIPGVEGEHAEGTLITGADGSSQLVFLHPSVLAGGQTIAIPTITMEGEEVTLIDGTEVPQHTIEFIMEETV